jgi:hypothetical protein
MLQVLQDNLEVMKTQVKLLHSWHKLCLSHKSQAKAGVEERQRLAKEISVAAHVQQQQRK